MGSGPKVQARDKLSKLPPPGKIVAAVVADCHVGNHARNGGSMEAGLNRRGRESVEALRRAVKMARAAGAPRFVVAGDLFHSRRPEPAVIRAVQDALAEAGDGMQVCLVPGNHDMLDATARDGNTAMAPLYDVADVIVTSATWEGPILLAPFWGERPMADYLEATLEEQSQGPSKPRMFLVTHVGLWDEKGAAPWQRRARDGMSADALLRMMVDGHFCAAVVGNYHEHRWWTQAAAKKGTVLATAIQAGTLCPASHGDGGLKERGLMIYLREDGTWDKVEVPGPRFLTVVPGDAVPPPAPPGFSYYVRTRGRWVDGDPVLAASEGGWTACDREEGPAVDAGEEAARAEEETDEQAIAATVEEADLPEGVSRAAVGALALQLWGRA